MVERSGISLMEREPREATVAVFDNREVQPPDDPHPITFAQIEEPMALLVRDSNGARTVLDAAAQVVLGYYSALMEPVRFDLMARGFEKKIGELVPDLSDPNAETAASARIDSFRIIQAARRFSTAPVRVFPHDGVKQG